MSYLKRTNLKMSVYHLLSNEYISKYYPASMPKITPLVESVIDKAVLENYTYDRIHELQYEIHFGGTYDPDSYISIILNAVYNLRAVGKPKKGSAEWKSIINPSADEWNRKELQREAEVNEHRRTILAKCNELAEDFAKKTVADMANIYATSNPDFERWEAITRLVDAKKLAAVKRRASSIRYELLFSRSRY